MLASSSAARKVAAMVEWTENHWVVQLVVQTDDVTVGYLVVLKVERLDLSA